MKKLILLSLLLLSVNAWSASSPFGPVPPDNTPYNATTWNGNLRAPTKNAVRDVLETVVPGGVVNATQVNGLAVPTSKTVVGTNGSGQIIDATASVAIPATSGSLTCIPLGGNNICGYANAILDEGTITLPTITANYSAGGIIRVSAAGVIRESCKFEVGSDGNVSLIYATANVVVGAACADNKVCISTAAAQNPIVIQVRDGAGNLSVEFWYR